MNDFLSTSEAAKFLGVSRVTLFNRIKNGQIQAMKVGGSYIIPRQEIEDLLNKKMLSSSRKIELEKGVDRVVNEYGETLKLLKDS